MAAARGQVKPRRVVPLPGDPVGRQEDQRGSPGLVATGHVRADGDKARGRPLHRADLVAGEQRYPGAGRQRPAPAVRARPDRAGAEGDPHALAAGHEDGAVPGRRHAAVGRPDRSHRPGTPVVERHEELGSRDERAGLRAHRDDLVADARHPAERLADAAAAGRWHEVVAGQGRRREAEGGRGRRGARIAAVRVRYHDHGDTEDDHREDRDRHPDPPAPELQAGQEFPGPPALDRLGQQRAQQAGPLGAGRPQFGPDALAPLALLAPLAPPWPLSVPLAGRSEGDGVGRGSVLRPVIELESGHGDRIVTGPRLRRHGQRLAQRRGVPEEPRLAAGGVASRLLASRPFARHVLGPHVPGPGWPAVKVPGERAGLGPLGSPAWPGAPPLELEPGGGPAPRIGAGWGGAWAGPRRPGARGARWAPAAVSPGMAGRFPGHVCLAVKKMPPGGKCRKRGMNPENLYAIPADGTGRPPA